MATTGEVSAAPDHLARLIGGSPMTGLAELVWNCLDAEADLVDVTIDTTELGATCSVTVADNGHGFLPEEVPQAFSKVGGSWKNLSTDRKSRNKTRELHGEKGQGRWKAFAIGDRVEWSSVAKDTSDSLWRSTVTISRDSLARYSYTTEAAETGTEVGTTVTVEVGSRQPDSLLRAEAASSLTSIVALYLTQYPEVTINFNDASLSIDDLVARRNTLQGSVTNAGDLEVTVIEWHPAVERTLFLCDVNGATLDSTNVGIRAPGFNFTAYVRWDGFREYQSHLMLAEMGGPELGPALETARDLLRKHFQDRRDEDLRSVVDSWREENVYPYAEEPGDVIGQAEQALFNYVAVTASGAVNTIEDHGAKKLSLATMRAAVEADPSSIEFIFREILKLPESKIEELRSLLETTSLDNLIDAMRLVTGRLDFLMGLETLLFDKNIAPHVRERSHIHKLIESAPWLFGEEFATHVSDQRLTTLLKAHLKCLGRDELVDYPVEDTSGNSLRRVDFMFGRSLEFNRQRLEHLVVEIKRPSLTVGEAEVRQLHDYRKAIVGDARFDVEAVNWDFVLVGTEFTDDVKDLLGQANRHPNLIHDKNGVRVWVRKWSDVLAENRHRLKFIRDQLDYDPSAGEAISYLKANFPDYLPHGLTSTAGEAKLSDQTDEE